jgi:hypothetical protein
MRRVWFLPLLLATLTAFAQDPLKAYPKNYSLAFDNDVISVIRVHYGPNEHIGVHDHSSYPTIYAYLNDSGPVHFKHDENPPFEITRPPSTKGSFRVSPGRIERHSVDNLSDKSSDFLRIELKKIPVDSPSIQAFRDKAPDEPLRSERVVEFKSQQFAIERVVCVGSAPCTLEGFATPSLLIALSPMNVKDAGVTPGVLLKDGDIRWVSTAQPVSFSSTTNSPVHLLRITFTTQPK